MSDKSLASLCPLNNLKALKNKFKINKLVNNNSFWKYIISGMMFATCFYFDKSRAQDYKPIVQIDTGQRIFQIPFAYLAARTVPEAQSLVVKWPTFSFAFWMPGAEPTEKAAVAIPYMVPSQPNRAPGEPLRYIVLIQNILSIREGRPTRSDDLRIVPPWRKLENILSDIPRLSFNKKFDMLEIRWPPHDLLGINYYGSHYFSEYRSDGVWLINCPSDQNLISRNNHICTGSVAFRELDLYFELRIPDESLPEISSAINTAINLLSRWVSPPLINLGR